MAVTDGWPKVIWKASNGRRRIILAVDEAERDVYLQVEARETGDRHWTPNAPTPTDRSVLEAEYLSDLFATDAADLSIVARTAWHRAQPARTVAAS